MFGRFELSWLNVNGIIGQTRNITLDGRQISLCQAISPGQAGVSIIFYEAIRPVAFVLSAIALFGAKIG